MENNTHIYSHGADSGITMPLTFELSGGVSGNMLICKTVVRALPGKRLVCLASWGDDDVFVKIFIDPKDAKRHWQREQRGIRALLDGNILTPPLLYSGAAVSVSTGPLCDTTNYLLVLKRIAPAITLGEGWKAADNKERAVLLRSMITVLAAHHCAGLMHTDTHFGNFLLRGEDIFTLDGDRIEVFDAPLNRKKSLHSLGLLFGQLTADYDDCVGEVFSDYLKLRGWTECVTDKNRLQAEINSVRKYRKDKFLKKIFRECSSFICRKHSRQIMVYDRFYDSVQMRRLLQDPDCFLNDAACKFIKRGNTATVGIIDIDGRALVVKRYNIKGFWHGINRAFRRSRAAISWRNAHLLNFYEIATPTPVALIEKCYGPLRRVSYFISAYVEGSDCARYFSNGRLSDAEQTGMAEKLITLLGKLAQARISHGDLKATNIIISQGNPVLLDLDGMRQHTTIAGFYRTFARDIQRFLKNWDNDVALQQIFAQRLLDNGKKHQHISLKTY